MELISAGRPVGRHGPSSSVSALERRRSRPCSMESVKGLVYVQLTSRNGLNIISKSLSRVAKKASQDDVEGFTKGIMANIETTTDA